MKNNAITIIFRTAKCVAGATFNIYRRAKSDIWLAISPALCACRMENSMERNIYMTTGEFAKTMSVTKETLFHYDEIKLFSPDVVAVNGYRYYSIYQVETLDTILLLRDLGMSLKEIRDFIKTRNSESFMKLFAEREQQIDKEIARLKAMKDSIRQRKYKIKLADELDFSEIGIKEFPMGYCLYGEADGKSIKEILTKVNELITEFQLSGSYGYYDIVYMQSEDKVKKGIYNEYMGAALLVDKKPKVKNYKQIKAGKYLTAYHIGYYDTIGKAYERIREYKEKYGLATDDVYIERGIIDNFTTDDVEEYVTEITVRVVG